MTARLSAAELAERLGLPVPTPEQQRVIEAPPEPFLVVAGAGSGKTETMAARVVHLVANGLVDPGAVLGLTFTRKAAGQLGTRIRTRLAALAAAGIGPHAVLSGNPPGEAGEPEVSTYHAFAGRVLAEFGALVGVEPAARVLTATSAWQLARRVVGQWEGDLDTDRSPDQVTEIVLALAGTMSDHLVDADQLTGELRALRARILAAPPSPRQKRPLQAELERTERSLRDREWAMPLVAAFAEAKHRAGAVDFADQMRLTAELVLAAPQVGAELRARYRVVLLDEYQDTGHAQRVILRGLFGSTSTGAGHAVTAVGDPVQSIYTWRGASSSNLARFGQDFPLADGSPSPRLTLLTSFRNPVRVLELANAVSDPVRADVDGLRPRPGAPAGTVRCALLPTVAEENAWLVDRIVEERSRPGPPPTTAVLMRRRHEMAGLAELLRERGVPVEVVGLGGLLAEPEVADVVATLRLLVDPHAGAAAQRLLAGARWRLGSADLAALADRARELTRRRRGEPAEGAAAVRAALAEAVDTEDGDDVPSLVDAITDPGEPDRYSPAGAERLARFAAELQRLRRRLGQPLPDLVAEIEHTTGLDVEVAVAGAAGRAHLDAFAAVVADFAAVGGGVPELLDHLDTADEREDGLAPGEIEVDPDRVQILTVHAAKGLEWEVVAVPQLSSGVFPGTGKQTWMTDPSQLPPPLRGDADDVPQPALPDDPAADQSEVLRALQLHRERYQLWQAEEEQRLAYVALTRSEHTLLLSGHHWGATQLRPRGPSPLLEQLAAVLAGAAADPGPQPEVWAPPPGPDETNPQTREPRTALWPADPLVGRREAVRAAAAAVRAALARRAPGEGAVPPGGEAVPPGEEAVPPGEQPVGPDELGWAHDVDVLLAERRQQGGGPQPVGLPASVSVTALVELAKDPAELARRLRRPVPLPPAPQARRGTAFHAWIEQLFSGDALLGVDELPGADDRDAVADHRLGELQEAFRRSSWSHRTPVRVEVPFTTRIAGLGVRGRMDAVFADPDGGATVVDWKTGHPPTGAAAAAAAVQLAVYRLAWSELSGTPLDRVRAAFHHVGDDVTLAPVDLLDREGLEALVSGAATSGEAVVPGGDARDPYAR